MGRGRGAGARALRPDARRGRSPPREALRLRRDARARTGPCGAAAARDVSARHPGPALHRAPPPVPDLAGSRHAPGRGRATSCYGRARCAGRQACAELRPRGRAARGRRAARDRRGRARLDHSPPDRRRVARGARASSVRRARRRRSARLARRLAGDCDRARPLLPRVPARRRPRPPVRGLRARAGGPLLGQRGRAALPRRVRARVHSRERGVPRGEAGRPVPHVCESGHLDRRAVRRGRRADRRCRGLQRSDRGAGALDHAARRAERAGLVAGGGTLDARARAVRRGAARAHAPAALCRRAGLAPTRGVRRRGAHAAQRRVRAPGDRPDARAGDDVRVRRTRDDPGGSVLAGRGDRDVRRRAGGHRRVSELRFRDFSHITVRVSDMERALAFYRDGLGLNAIFDVKLDGPGLEGVTGTKGASGRMVGLVVPGSGKVCIELLGFSRPKSERPPQGRFTGYANISLSVDDLDAAHAACIARGLRPLQKPIEVGGVRMFFLADPDGTPIEVIEFPRGATTSAAFNGV